MRRGKPSEKPDRRMIAFRNFERRGAKKARWRGKIVQDKAKRARSSIEELMAWRNCRRQGVREQDGARWLLEILKDEVQKRRAGEEKLFKTRQNERGK